MTAKPANGILAYATAAVSVIGALTAAIVAIRQGTTHEKIEVVKDLADGNLSKVSEDLKTANALAKTNADRVAALEKLLTERSAPAEVKVVNTPEQPVPTKSMP